MDIPFGTIVALLGGMAIGLERQWSGHATGPQARFAGIRTFALLGGLAGVAGWLWASGLEAIAIVLLAAASALIVVAYVTASRTDIDATTEVSAIVVLAAGVLAGVGQLTLASAIFAVTSLFLLEKSRLHALAARIDDDSLRAAVRFAVMAVVVLPLLPEGPFGPADSVRPRELWMLVLFCSGLSFAAFLASRLAGADRGYAIAGTFGGLISSTNVAFTFARASRGPTTSGSSLAVGVLAACTVLFVRVAVVTFVLNAELARAVVWYLLVPFTISVAIVAWQISRAPDTQEAIDRSHNPLQLWSAMQMAVVFQLVLMVVALVQRTWGDPGIVVSGAVLGLVDLDALTIAMARGAGAIPIDTAARAIVIGLLANTGLKMGVATAIGVGSFRRLTAPALAVIGLAIAGSLVLHSAR
jgi:uncharacterized membrane protein (DUF4010 family)